MVIYKTTNLVNGKVYVGKDERNNPNYIGSGLLIQNAIKKYGKENFVKEIIEQCSSKKQLSEREKYWIKELNTTNLKIGYNLTDGGSGGNTYEHNQKLPEIKKKLTGKNNHFYGKHHSSESKRKISSSNIGKKAWNKGKTGIYSDDTLQLMREYRKDLVGENHPKWIEIDIEEIRRLLKEGYSARKISTHFGVKPDVIYLRIKRYKLR